MTNTSAIPNAIFKANDIRGIYGETLRDGTARQIGAMLANAANDNGGKIAIGRDGRLSSPALAAALIEGLVAGGVEVLDIGLAPTPALYFAALEHAGGNGVMITGSHNPPKHNGMKMMFGGKILGGKQARELAPAASSQNGGRGGAKTLTIMDEYIDAICKDHRPAQPLHLVIDAGNGSAGVYAAALYQKLGHKVTALFCEADGNFPNHHPDPAQPENLRHADAAMREQNADAAFVFDGDGDRLGVLLPKAGWVFPDRLLMLLARDLLTRHQGANIVFDVKCTAQLQPWIEQHGGVGDMQPTGHAFIKARMRETGALLGGEMSGHFYFAENWRGFDDALLAGAKFAAILAGNPNAMDDIPSCAASPEIVLGISGSGHEIIDNIRANADFADAQNIVTIDGLRAEYADGFGLVRASNTTASLVLRFEGKDDAALQRIKESFAKALATVGLTLPADKT